MITEYLMRPGSGALRLVPDVPTRITDAIRVLVDENAGSSAVGAHIVITPIRLDVDTFSDANVLAAASYTGAISARPSRLSVEFVGLGRWLDSYSSLAWSRSAGTPTQWTGDLLANGLTAGTITGGSNVTRTFPAYAQTRRHALDAWVQRAGLEYRIRPDFTVDFAAAATLFESPPTVVATRRDEGPDGSLRGVEGGLIDQALTRLGPQLRTTAYALGSGLGDSIDVGSEGQTLNLKTPAGGTPALVDVFSTPAEEGTSLDDVATSYLNLQGMRRAIKVSSRTHHISRFVTPGDEVYVYDIAAGLIDPTNEVTFRGEVIYPAVVRLLSYNWPIENGSGVYLRSNAATPTYTDLTDWVEWESGDTWWTVGDWSPPGYGPVNRTSPNIEERVAAASQDSYTPALTAITTNPTLGTGSSSFGNYVRNGDRVEADIRIVWGSSGTAAGSGGYRVSVPLSIDTTKNVASSIGGRGATVGTWCADDNSGGLQSGVVQAVSSTTVMLLYGSSVVTHAVPWGWGASDALNLSVSYFTDA